MALGADESVAWVETAPTRLRQKLFSLEQPTHVAVKVVQFDGQRILIKLRKSSDAGRSWSADRIVAETRGSADHPVLVNDSQRLFLSWMTRDEGYRLLPLDDL